MNKNTQLAVDENEIKRKKALEASIARKRRKLSKLQIQLELCSEEIAVIREEYESRIGKLFAKDNQLDIEIIRYKNITKLMQQGISYQEATKEIDNFYKDFLDFEPTETDTVFEEDFAQFERNNPNEKFVLSLKKLWKKLLFQFHPDLVTDTKEKLRREQIVKKINKAYKENNIDDLKLLESQWYIDEFQSGSADQLEYVLIEIENIIITLENQFKQLKATEWYNWKILKIKNSKRDIFADLEKSLLDDIICKTKILENLKNQIDKNELL